MTSETKSIVQKLKENGEDYEFYPTTREMVKSIFDDLIGDDYRTYNNFRFLDIGCGTCNFMKYWNEIASTKSEECRLSINARNYYVIEKSKYLIDLLDKDIVVLGTDFMENTLLDKEVDIVFCNPPYSEYESWMTKILQESTASSIYMIIPERWRENETINSVIEKYGYGEMRESFLANKYIRDKDLAPIKSIGKFDFSHADRVARCKVEIVRFKKVRNVSKFDILFDDMFHLDISEKKKEDYETEKEDYENVKQEISTAENKIEMLVKSYNAAYQEMYDSFQEICKVKSNVLKAIGVSKNLIKEALKMKIENLKKLYWKSAFDCLNAITTRLTSKSRSELLDRFNKINKIDFTAKNIYATIVWVIKNANSYSDEQIVKLFIALSSEKSIQSYKSNKKFFNENRSRWTQHDFYNRKVSKYTLDYRLVVDSIYLPCEDRFRNYDNNPVKKDIEYKLSDILTVLNNLGFPNTSIEYPETYGKMGIVKGIVNGKETELIEFRAYQNRNLHLKFNIETMKALNVVAARILKWIITPDDIKKEFDNPEMAEGAEKYFNCYQALPIVNAVSYLPSYNSQHETCDDEEKDNNTDDISNDDNDECEKETNITMEQMTLFDGI